MSGKIRRFHTAEFKARVTLEALKEDKTIGEIGAKYGLHPKLVSQWKQEFVENASSVFARNKKDTELQYELNNKERRIEDLYKEVGQLTLEVNGMKKKSKQAGLM